MENSPLSAHSSESRAETTPQNVGTHHGASSPRSFTESRAEAQRLIENKGDIGHISPINLKNHSAPLREISPEKRGISPEKRGISLRSPQPEELPALEALYLTSFPPEERRPWQDIAAGEGPELLCIDIPQRPAAGLVTLWHFPQFTYIEHLCTHPTLRGRGIGTAVMAALKAAADAPLLLEAEPPATPGGIEERRIAFYRRCGLHVLPGSYVQPPYGPGLPAVPLVLMSTDAALHPVEAARILHKHVYRCQASN